MVNIEQKKGGQLGLTYSREMVSGGQKKGGEAQSSCMRSI